MSQSHDIVVIGANVGGLVAAVMAAKGGARVVLVEQRLALVEPDGALFALDPEVIAALDLARHGLRFTQRDLPLVAWDEESPPLTLAPRRHAGFFSNADAKAWDALQKSLGARARALRGWWWNPHDTGQPKDLLPTPAERTAFSRESLMGAEDFLNLHLESPRLRSLLLFDAVAGGFAPSEPGSALALTWRAAQEMAGLQGATALAAPGTLIVALTAAAKAAGVELRLGASVTAIHEGVRLSDGEEIAARTVISSLPRAATEKLAGLDTPAPTGSVGDAQIVFTLEGVALPKGRVIVAPPLEAYADAHATARAGKLPTTLPLQCISDAPGRLVVTARLVPVSPPGGWNAMRAPLAAAVAKNLARHIPGFVAAMRGAVIKPPALLPRATLSQLLAPGAARAATRVPNLYLCGQDAEPLPCVSGRAGRFAAQFAGRKL